VHAYVTGNPSDGGLGIHPDNDAWPRVESIMALHDPEYNDVWIRSVTKTFDVGHEQLDFIRSQVRASSPTTRQPLNSFSLERPSLSTLPFLLPTLIRSS